MSIKEKYISKWELEMGRKMAVDEFDQDLCLDWLEVEHESLIRAVKKLAAMVAS